MTREATRCDYEARIDQVLTYVERHLDEELSPARLARVAHFSGYHFHRVFRGVTGESVMECVRRLRLERAARRLRATDDSVTEVAFQAGFSSHEAFTRAFAARFGEPPQVFRGHDGARIETLRASGRMAVPEVQLRTTRARRFVHLRGTGTFADVGPAWVALVTLARDAGLYSGSETLVGRYPDDPEITPPGRVRFDVGLVCDHARPAPAPLRDGVLPAGRWAVALHEGSYATLSETYLRLVGGWFVTTGRALADGPCLETYLHPPETTDERLLRTEVWAPLA
ncbi:MAG: AraC family transcriptional regulator [Myxococcota bacterium]